RVTLKFEDVAPWRPWPMMSAYQPGSRSMSMAPLTSVATPPAGTSSRVTATRLLSLTTSAGETGVPMRYRPAKTETALKLLNWVPTALICARWVRRKVCPGKNVSETPMPPLARPGALLSKRIGSSGVPADAASEAKMRQASVIARNQWVAMRIPPAAVKGTNDLARRDRPAASGPLCDRSIKPIRAGSRARRRPQKAAEFRWAGKGNCPDCRMERGAIRCLMRYGAQSPYCWPGRGLLGLPCGFPAAAGDGQAFCGQFDRVAIFHCYPARAGASTRAAGA